MLIRVLRFELTGHRSFCTHRTRETSNDARRTSIHVISRHPACSKIPELATLAAIYQDVLCKHCQFCSNCILLLSLDLSLSASLLRP